MSSERLHAEIQFRSFESVAKVKKMIIDKLYRRTHNPLRLPFNKGERNSNRDTPHIKINTCMLVNVCGTICHRKKRMNFEEGNVHYLMCNELGIRELLHYIFRLKLRFNSKEFIGFITHLLKIEALLWILRHPCKIIIQFYEDFKTIGNNCTAP